MVIEANLAKTYFSYFYVWVFDAVIIEDRNLGFFISVYYRFESFLVYNKIMKIKRKFFALILNLKDYNH